MLKSVTVLENKLVPCLFFCPQEQKLIALITVHVHDALMTGTPEAQFTREQLNSELKFGNWEALTQGTIFLGRHPRRSLDGHTISMEE